VLACLALVGCGKKDDQINAYVNEINTFTDELVKKVDSAPTPSQGVDDAQKYMDSRKADLKEKFNSVKNIGENQVSEETKKKMQESFYNDGMKMGQLMVKHGQNPEVSSKLKKLIEDFQSLFK
jgi:Tfp pilus assembly protein PilP